MNMDNVAKLLYYINAMKTEIMIKRMMKILNIAIFFIFSSSSALALECDTSFEIKTTGSLKFAESTCVSFELDIEEIEAIVSSKHQKFISMMKEKKPDSQLPKVLEDPWGKKRDEWNKFKNRLSNDDQIRAISSVGGEGYIMVRNGHVIDLIITTLY